MQAWQLGSYEVVRRLGEGGMAQVYLARDVRLDREVAVKVLDKQLAERHGFRERFLREARVSAALDHPNIVPIFDFGDTGNLLYLVMPYISGGSLQQELHRTPMPASEVVSYGTQMADALQYAHERGVVHRDVKPANMLLHADGRLMLTDFGLAKILDGSPRPAAPRNQPDAGTPEYMAPEQIEGRTDERSDIYAMGVVLYLLLTGHLPFTGPTSGAVMEGHLYRLPEEPRRLNPAITPALQTVIMQALAKHPQDRFQRANEMGAALLSALVAGNAEPLPFLLSNPISQPTSQPGASPATPPVLTPSAAPSLAPVLSPSSFPVPTRGRTSAQLSQGAAVNGAVNGSRYTMSPASRSSGQMAALRGTSVARPSGGAPLSQGHASMARAGTGELTGRPSGMRLTVPPALHGAPGSLFTGARPGPAAVPRRRGVPVGQILLWVLVALLLMLLSAALVVHLTQIHYGTGLLPPQIADAARHIFGSTAG